MAIIAGGQLCKQEVPVQEGILRQRIPGDLYIDNKLVYGQCFLILAIDLYMGNVIVHSGNGFLYQQWIRKWVMDFFSGNGFTHGQWFHVMGMDSHRVDGFKYRLWIHLVNGFVYGQQICIHWQ